MEQISLSGISRFIIKGLRYIGWLILIVLFTWLFKALLFSVYYIPSGSMLPTLKVGDYVLVAKFPYNLRTPEYYPLTGIPFPYHVIKGLGTVHRGDIMVFDLPLFPAALHPSQKEDYIKRCTGMPGDTVLVFEGHYLLKRSIKGTNDVKSLSAHVIAKAIPAKGARIKLTDSTKHFWQPILVRDGNTVAVDSTGHMRVNGIRKTTYRVKQNYYFVQGDNIKHSADSRYWGLVPQRNLIGRAVTVLWPWLPKLL